MKGISVFVFGLVLLGRSAGATPVAFQLGANGPAGNHWEPGAGWGIDTAVSETFLGAIFSVNEYLPDESFALNVGESTAFKYGSICLDETDILRSETDELDLTLWLNLSSPYGVDLVSTPATATVTLGDIVDERAAYPTYKLNRKVWVEAVPEQTDLSIHFAPLFVAFGDGGEFKVEFRDIAFIANSTQRVDATVTLLAAPAPDLVLARSYAPSPVPEPGSLLLLGIGLIGLIGLDRRRRR